MKRFIKILVFVFLAAGITSAGYFWLNKRNASRLSWEQAQLAQETQQKIVLENLKEAEPEPAATDNNSGTQEEPGAKNIPDKYLLVMPFYSQAPFSQWDAFHEDMCEEASLLNAGLYLLEKKLSLEKYDKELETLQEIEKKEIGEWKSTTISQVKKLVEIYFEGRIKTKIIENPTIEDIEAEIAAGLPAGEAGHPVVVPLAGRDIGNPNYRQPGPIYHMLVVKGYDEKFFITNDVGTRKGESYVYRKEVLMNNMHDWSETDIHKGEQRILVLYK